MVTRANRTRNRVNSRILSRNLSTEDELLLRSTYMGFYVVRPSPEALK